MTTRPAAEPADKHGADTTELTGTTATTAEEAMDAVSEVEGFADESAYSPTPEPAPTSGTPTGHPRPPDHEEPAPE